MVLAGDPTLSPTSDGGLLGAARLLPQVGTALLLKAPISMLDISGVEAPVSGLEGGIEAVSVEVVVDSSVGVSVGVKEVERAEVTAAFLNVVPAKRWDREA